MDLYRPSVGVLWVWRSGQPVYPADDAETAVASPPLADATPGWQQDAVDWKRDVLAWNVNSSTSSAGVQTNPLRAPSRLSPGTPETGADHRTHLNLTIAQAPPPALQRRP
jgi:hypothetical protein